MLEDDFTDVLRKALLGHALAPAAAAARAGMAETDLLAFLGGAFSEETARVMADLLGLKARAFAGHPFYQPTALADHPGIRRLGLPFGGGHVNAWLLDVDGQQVLFDTGAGGSGLMEEIGTSGGKPVAAFITHSHRDHTGGVGDLLEAGIPVFGPDGCGAAPLRPGDTMPVAGLRIHACDLSGHCVPSLGYHVDARGVPVLVTGDALFAGSIGGCPTPSRYQLALARLAGVLDPLPDHTILLPGHGPATTLGEERVSNPFL